MIVATAGHIDHGKTLLVKTLTGVDTDRLPEEKARGISIDLGFAYLPLADGQSIGFVDVPGHERFIRNMLAGVCGIDYALLVVAADDGIMPQTIEHLHIIDLLRVTRGAAVITKIDRVDASRALQVRENVEALLASGRLSGVPVLPVSAVSGEGMGELRGILEKEAAAQVSRLAAGQNFRLAVDRAFTVAGSGTVVTGTVFNGTVRTGDKLVMSPAGLEVRVRGIQIQGKPAQQASAGQRCALNLTGVDLEAVQRGDWALAPVLHQPTQRLDVDFSVLTGEEEPLEHWTPVHVHLATADVTARIAIRAGNNVPPGASAIVQLVLDHPVSALNGDRFIVRDQSATRTIGGGTVLDPFPPRARRSSPARLAELKALAHPAPEDALAALLENPDGAIDLARFELLFNLTSERAAALYAEAGLMQIGRESRVAIPRKRHDELRDAAVAHVAAFHRAQPQAPGVEVEAVRAAVAADLSTEIFTAVLRALADERKLEITGTSARLPGHNATANAADDQLWQTIRPALEAAGYAPPALKDLALQLKLKEAIVKDFLYRKAKSGAVYRVTTDRFYSRDMLATLAATAQATAQAQTNGLFTAAQFRDATGIGRSLAIEILEFLDTLAITQRVGDTRKMRKDFVPILGAASPAPRPAAGAAKTASAPPASPPRSFHKPRR